MLVNELYINILCVVKKVNKTNIHVRSYINKLKRQSVLSSNFTATQRNIKKNIHAFKHCES